MKNTKRHRIGFAIHAIIFPLVVMLLSTDSFAAQRKVAPKASAKRVVRRVAPAVKSPAPARLSAEAKSANNASLMKARKFAQNGQYQEASRLLFQMSRSPQFAADSAQIKYILGLTLFEMKLNQPAAFVFYDVVRQESRENPRSRYIRQSLEKLAIAADALDSDVLLRYAIKQVKEDEFPAASRDMLYYRTAELRMQEKQYAEAARQFARVRSSSSLFNRARYNLGLALAEAGELEKAQAAFEDLADRTKELGVTDKTHVNALLGRARVIYQRQQFSGAIEAYRDIPRDTEQWHDALFESSWAMLRDGRFRSALSNFHSLHSPYYEDVYQPESLLLRAIVYLYICRYDEMEKVLGLFERVYKPVQRDIGNILTGVTDPLIYFREIAKIEGQFEEVRHRRTSRSGFQIPFVVARQVLKEGDVSRTFGYLHNLDKERRHLESLPPNWRNSSIGLYAKKIIEKRIESTRVLAGKQIRRHLILTQNELRDLFEQNGFLRFEMISGKKESLRKEIQGKGLPRTQVDDQTAREFYIQNGFEYWPFQGEYWLDEIGNYHYVGVKACE
jgi:tetratricopeptide (TPR) repeat protein